MNLLQISQNLIPRTRPYKGKDLVKKSKRKTLEKKQEEDEEDDDNEDDDDEEKKIAAALLQTINLRKRKPKCDFCIHMKIIPQLKGHMCCEGLYILNETIYFLAQRSCLMIYLKKSSLLHVTLRSIIEQSK